MTSRDPWRGPEGFQVYDIPTQEIAGSIQYDKVRHTKRWTALSRSGHSIGIFNTAEEAEDYVRLFYRKVRG